MEPIFWGLVTALIIYELVALWTTKAGDTISEIIWDRTVKYPIIPFLMGLLMGHFFW